MVQEYEGSNSLKCFDDQLQKNTQTSRMKQGEFQEPSNRQNVSLCRVADPPIPMLEQPLEKKEPKNSS